MKKYCYNCKRVIPPSEHGFYPVKCPDCNEDLESAQDNTSEEYKDDSICNNS